MSQGSRRARRAGPARLEATRARPERALGPVVGAVLVLGAWAAIAHSSGAGWVQVLGAILAAFVVVGMVLPAFAVARAELRVVHAPSDTSAGEPVALEVEVNRPLRLRPRAPAGPTTVTGASSRAAVTVVAARRGVVTDCVLDVASAAPFGLLWWKKRVVLRLPRPLFVAPRLGEPDPACVVPDHATGVEQRRVPSRVGEPRGVRPYQHGDLRHWVHWGATAHAGTLMVREMEEPSARPATVRALLSEDDEVAERQAERVYGTVARLLASGRDVRLVTTELGGTVAEPVRTVTEAGRRLARAVAVPPPPTLRPSDGAR